jgi:four helix bundle protein
VSTQSDELKDRAMSFAVNVLRLLDSLPATPSAQVVARQLAKSATSVSANCVAACTARSHAEFIAKLCIVNEEADETVHWLTLIVRMPYLREAAVLPVQREAIELRAIFGRSLATARSNARHRD